VSDLQLITEFLREAKQHSRAFVTVYCRCKVTISPAKGYPSSQVLLNDIIAIWAARSFDDFCNLRSSPSCSSITFTAKSKRPVVVKRRDESPQDELGDMLGTNGIHIYAMCAGVDCGWSQKLSTVGSHLFLKRGQG
jgi:hypothetical protein